MNNSLNNTIETIVFIPHNKNRYKYSVNSGSFNYISYNSITSFLLQVNKSFSHSNKHHLKDFIHRIQPFFYIVKDDILMEMRKLHTNTYKEHENRPRINVKDAKIEPKESLDNLIKKLSGKGYNN